MNLNQAKQLIQKFKDQFAAAYGEGHYIFACHAAFPIGFTPDMLYQIWANFRLIPPKPGQVAPPEEIDLIAVSDLLLSPLCNKTGRNIYEMDVKVRGLLLEELRTERFAQYDRFEELAFFIFQYLDSVVAQFEFKSFYETLRWNTLVTLSPKQAFHKITEKLGEYIRENNEGEIMRMRNLLESFAYQDKGMEKMEESNFRRLLDYTKALKAHMLGYNANVINRQVEKSGAVAFTDDPNAADHYYEIPLLEQMVDQVAITQDNPERTKEPPLPTKEIYALLVGVDEYIYPSLRLSGCLNDVALMSAYLKETINKDHDYKLLLTSLTNEKATAKNVTQTLQQFKKEAGPEDIVLFYFAGHSIKDALNLDYTSLVLHDTLIEWKDQKVEKADEFNLETLVSGDWACDVVLFIDTHYSAAVIPNNHDHIIFFASCGVDQQAFEHRIGKRTNGLFTFNVVKALRESKQELTYLQLFQQVLGQMQASGFDQTPVLIADQQRTYKYVLGEYATQSEELIKRIEAVQSGETTELDLSGFQLTFIPPEIFALDSLRDLNLSNNQIDGIPTKLALMSQLEKLDLRNNQITRINLDVLAMPNLKEFYLSGNPIADIPPEILDGGIERFRDYLSEIKKNARNFFAIFIAIDEYPAFPDGNQINLRAAVSDAKALRQMFKSHFQADQELDFGHWDFFDGAATKEGIIEILGNIISETKENDVFLCYFAGHDTTLKSGEAAWVLANSTGNFDGTHEISTSELAAQVQLLLDKHVNTILLNPPKWGPVQHENLVVVEPGMYNNEGPMADGSYHSHFAYKLCNFFEAEKGQLPYQFFQRMDEGKSSFYTARTGSKEMPRLKTIPLNYNKVFLRSELGYGSQIRRRFQEAQSSNVLDLSGMNLDHIPPMVYELENLNVLNLAGNNIDFLPPKILDLNALERLELEGNPILNLPQGILIEGGVRDFRNYFETLEVDELSIPVVLSIFNDLEGHEAMKPLPEELTQFLKPHQEKGLLEVETLVDPSTDDIYRLFYKHQHNSIALVNFSTDSDSRHLHLYNPAGTKVHLKPETIARLMVAPDNIQLLIMDGAYSESVGKSLTDLGVQAAIGVKDLGYVDQSMQFWRSFYQQLANGLTIKQAFDRVRLEFEQDQPQFQQQTRNYGY